MCCKKNRNILWGLIIFLAFTGCDKEEMLINSWNLQTVLMNNEPLNDSTRFNIIPKYTYYSFYYANSLTVSTLVNGKYTSSSNGSYRFADRSTLTMHFTLLYRTYDVTAEIKKLTRKELHLEYEDNGNTYFLKLYASQ